MDISTGLQNLILQLQSTLSMVQIVIAIIAVIAVFSLVMTIAIYSHVRKSEELLRSYFEEYEEE